MAESLSGKRKSQTLEDERSEDDLHGNYRASGNAMQTLNPVAAPPYPHPGSSNRVMPSGITTFGEEIQSHETAIRNQVDEQLLITGELRDFLRAPMKECTPANSHKAIMNHTFMVIHFNSYCRGGTSNNLVPSEFALGLFSVSHGLQSCGASLINPDTVPVGMRADAMEMADSLGLPPIGRHARSGAKAMSPTAALRYILNICYYTGMHCVDGTAWFFAERNCIPVIQRCLDWMLENQLPDSGPPVQLSYRIIPLSALLVEVSSLIADRMFIDNARRSMMNEGSAERIINHSQFQYCPELGCDWHKEAAHSNFVEYCSKNITQRWIFNVLDFFCFASGTSKTVPTHAPKLSTVEIIDRALMRFFEEQCTRYGTESGCHIVDDEESRIIEEELDED